MTRLAIHYATAGRLELEPGQWRTDRTDEPAGRLIMRVVGVTTSSVPGWVTVSGWRQLSEQEPRLVRVLVPAEHVRPAAER